MNPTEKPFKAIIVGGGPVGLTAAHSFSRADIDFIVLEARNTCTPEAGSSLVLNPASMRVFHQLGLEDQARAASAETQRNIWVDFNGRTCKDVRPFSALDVR
jgi:2-polyprenyl-6-methoxyphenol hydroxylase-like FAD-dependent oxidoreductase